jgi:hypothetical protein
LFFNVKHHILLLGNNFYHLPNLITIYEIRFVAFSLKFKQYNGRLKYRETREKNYETLMYICLTLTFYFYSSAHTIYACWFVGVLDVPFRAFTYIGHARTSSWKNFFTRPVIICYQVRIIGTSSYSKLSFIRRKISA